MNALIRYCTSLTPGPAKRGRRLALMVLLAALVTACGEPRNHGRAVFILVDISADYAVEMEKARLVTNYVLGQLTSGDSIAIGFIDNSSYTERNYIARAEFDHRPSVTTQQKRVVRAELDAFLERFSVPSHHSDITGGVLLAADFFREADAGRNNLFLVSDLREDLMPGMKRDMSLGLEGVQVVAVNVTRQRSDNFDPQAYERRLTHWQQRIEGDGGEWRLANDLARLDEIASLR